MTYRSGKLWTRCSVPPVTASWWPRMTWKQQHWERDCASIDLVLTDIAMPGLSGPKLVRELRSTRPAGKVMIVSGNDDPAALESEKFLEQRFSWRSRSIIAGFWM